MAFELRDEDLQAILHAADLQLSKSELGALFRKPGHSNYRPAATSCCAISSRGFRCAGLSCTAGHLEW